MSRQPIPDAFTALDFPPLAPPRTLRTVLAGVGETLSRPLRAWELRRESDRITREIGALTVLRESQWRAEAFDRAEITSVLVRQKLRRHRLIQRQWLELSGKEGDSDGC